MTHTGNRPLRQWAITGAMSDQVQLLKLVEQFYATLLLQDDQVTSSYRAERTRDDSEDSNGPLSLQESLFEFLSQHYAVKVLAPISCHSFVTSLEEYSPNCRELWILSHTLCGSLDGCAIRYALLQASLVQTVSWVSQSLFAVFLKTIYPFLEEEETEQLGLNYVAHSDNHLSENLILDFLLFILLAHKDPLVTMLEGKLVEQPCRFIGCMMEAEFAEAMEKTVPGNSDLLCHRLFLQSLLSLEEGSNSGRQTLPIRNLAYIAAYLYRSSMQAKLQADLKEMEEKVKGLQKTRDDKTKGQVEVDGPQESRHSMLTVRKLAQKITT